MMQQYYRYIYILFLICLSGCTHHNQIIKRTILVPMLSEDNSFVCAQPLFKEPPPITIWVHGTRFFHAAQFNEHFDSTPSLKPALNFHTEHKFYKIAHTLYMHNHQEFPMQHIYFFGWSGHLNAQERKKTAAYLYCELLTLIKQYQHTYKKKPIIRIFAHSHGTNVVLNMTRFTDEKNPEIIIEEFISLASPVQTLTNTAPAHPMFNYFYNLYSSADLIQVIAPEIIYHDDSQPTKKFNGFKFPPFSQRRFPSYDNVIQAKIKFNGMSIGHIQYVSQSFVATLPYILSELRSLHEHGPAYLQDKELILSIRTTTPKKQKAHEMDVW